MHCQIEISGASTVDANSKHATVCRKRFNFELLKE